MRAYDRMRFDVRAQRWVCVGWRREKRRHCHWMVVGMRRLVTAVNDAATAAGGMMGVPVEFGVNDG